MEGNNMFETNEEVNQNLKQSILDYYMGHIKHKLKSLITNEIENEISSNIIQFLDAQIDTGNSLIVKEDIIKILNSVLIDSNFTLNNSNFEQSRIEHCLPDSSTITIDTIRCCICCRKIRNSI